MSTANVFATPDIVPFRAGKRTLGAFVFVILIEFVVFADVAGGSTFLPGNWAPFLAPIEFYIAFAFFGLLLLLLLQGIPASLTVPAGRFVFQLAAVSAATWAALTLIFSLGGTGPILPEVERIQEFILMGFFVAPVEELLFRVVLPIVFRNQNAPRNAPGAQGWILGSVVLFGLFHIPAYFLEGGSNLSILASDVGQAMVLGIVLWFVYSYTLTLRVRGRTYKINGGYGGSYGFHFTYNCLVLGVIAALPLAAAHLAVV
ncbi:MAG: CPBP family glutamic-type intramembrane protease [Thermoplasmata archaeon]